jgi:hypothetical protein
MLTAYGAAAVTFMMVMYALERRGRRYILGFACGCLLSSVYGFLAGAWPFGVVEVIWAGVALNRYRTSAESVPGLPDRVVDDDETGQRIGPPPTGRGVE